MSWGPEAVEVQRHAIWRERSVHQKRARRFPSVEEGYCNAKRCHYVGLRRGKDENCYWNVQTDGDGKILYQHAVCGPMVRAIRQGDWTVPRPDADSDWRWVRLEDFDAYNPHVARQLREAPVCLGPLPFHSDCDPAPRMPDGLP